MFKTERILPQTDSSDVDEFPSSTSLSPRADAVDITVTQAEIYPVNKEQPQNTDQGILTEHDPIPARRQGMLRKSAKKLIQMNRAFRAARSRTIAGLADRSLNHSPESPSTQRRPLAPEEPCSILICDYASEKHRFQRISPAAFIDLLEDHHACRAEDWVRVRWINLGGASRGVLEALAIRYGNLAIVTRTMNV